MLTCDAHPRAAGPSAILSAQSLHRRAEEASQSVLRGTSYPLALNVRADLFAQLTAMEEAGLPFDKTLSLVQLPARAQARLAAMRKRLRLGSDVADAGLKSGLFTPLEASLLHAAFTAGSPARTYRLLSEHYARRAARLAAMKSRLMLPVAMTVIAVFVRPLPNLLAGTLSPGTYLLKYLLPWAALAGAVYLLIELPRRLPQGSLALRSVPLDPLLPLVPLFGPIHVRRNMRDFFDSLALLLEAGMPMLQALPIAVRAIRNQAIKQQFLQIKSRIEGGASFAQAVSELSFVGHNFACAMIQSGEASGALPQMLFRYSQGEAATIDRFDDLVAEWIPRLVYTASALLIGYEVIRSGAFMPSLPDGLR
jgi:general secretion pathway protein F